MSNYFALFQSGLLARPSEEGMYMPVSQLSPNHLFFLMISSKFGRHQESIWFVQRGIFMEWRSAANGLYLSERLQHELNLY